MKDFRRPRRPGAARGGLPARLQEAAGLYDLSVLVATLDQPASGVQGRFDVQGVSFDNAQRLARHYLQAYERVAR